MTNNESHKRKKNLLSRLLSSISFLITEDVNTRDQRQGARVECRCEVHFVDEYGNKGQGYVVDISRQGLQLECHRKLSKGVTLALNAPDDETLDRTAPFMAKVRWSRKGESGHYLAGLALPPGVEEDPHWLESLLHQFGYGADGAQRREFIRAQAEVTGSLLLQQDEAEPVPVDIRNLSMGGALLKCRAELPKNGQFELSLGPVGDLPELKVVGTILRVFQKPGTDYYLHPSRFQGQEENKEREQSVLQEYILKYSDR